MSSERPMRFSFYWGGKVVMLANGSIGYDPPIAKKSLSVRRRIQFDELLSKVYQLMNVDPQTFKVSLILRNPVSNWGSGGGTYSGSPLVDDDDVQLIYDIREEISNYQAEIYVDTEEIVHVYQHMNAGDCQTNEGAASGSHHTHHMEQYVGISNYEVGGNIVQPEGEDEDSDYNVDDSDVQPDSEPEPTDISADESGSDDNATEEAVPGTQLEQQQQFRHNATSAYVFSDDLGPFLSHDATDRGHAEHLNVWNERNMDLKLGMLFESKEQLHNAVRQWSVKYNRQFEVRRSRSASWLARCVMYEKTPHCNWELRACKKATHHWWQITRFVQAHSCVRVANRNDHRHLTSNIIATNILEHIQNGPAYAVKEIRTKIKNLFQVDVSYKKAWFARRKAIDMVYGDWPSSVADLPKYVKELVATNPGTIVTWRHHHQSSRRKVLFDYIFWAFAPVVQAFPYLRPVISVDGTHMRGPYKAKLLIACGVDANNKYMPLAYALVDKESNESWSWFMNELRTNVCKDVYNICIVSDRHKGIINAMKTLDAWKEPIAIHRFCLIHVRANFNKKYKSHR